MITWDRPIPPLTLAEEATVAGIHAAVHITRTPDPAVVAVVNSLELEYNQAGVTFRRAVVLATLYPRWSWAHDREVLTT